MTIRTATLFSQTTDGRIKVWSCRVAHDRGAGTYAVVSTWGLLHGKQQTTQDIIRANSAKSAAIRANEEFDRQVLRKTRSGYHEKQMSTDRITLGQQRAAMDFSALGRGFAPAKPVREIPYEEAVQLDADGLLYKQRKRDGMRHYIVSDQKANLRVYSRGMDDMTEHFTRLTQELKLPPCTILDAEFVVTTQGGADDFTAVSEICRSKPVRAKQAMVHAELGGKDLRFVVFDLLFVNSIPMWKFTYAQRYAEMVELLEKSHPPSMTAFYHVVPIRNLQHAFRVCVDKMLKSEWEGLVLWRKDQATQVRLNRTPARCNCFKFKSMREGDFIATGFEFGSGKNSHVVGALTLALYSKIYGRRSMILKPLGNVGTGFDDATRAAALRWRYPCVVEVRYERMSETGLRFPAFLRKREDKKPNECVIEEDSN